MFRAALTSAYLERPCQVLSIPLWKTLAMCESWQTTREEAWPGAVSRLEGRTSDQYCVYWDRARRPPALSPDEQAAYRFALVHQDYIAACPFAHLASREAYFRLAHTGPVGVPPPLRTGLRLRDVAISSEMALAANVIQRCYGAPQPSAETVLSWTRHPVFDPALWVWAMDEATGQPAGLGIAELDASIGEGALEWIQVLPAYRGQGIGQAIVRELLARLRGRAVFTTVSGQVDNHSRPEALYRRCGFTGDDVWWVLRLGISS
jgi:GNAT superfamily N-acetyltransferase